MTGCPQSRTPRKISIERDCENRKAAKIEKARRQTSECKATLVWPRENERRRLRGKNDDGDGGAR